MMSWKSKQEFLTILQAKRKTLFDQTFEKFSAMPGLVTEDADGKKIDPEDPGTKLHHFA
jgi:hypothetical protein